MKDLALITIHGMGETNNDYYVGLESKLKRYLKSDWDKISFKNVQYASILQDSEDTLWQAMISESANKLSYQRLRQFFLYGFADAATLEYSAHRFKDKYIQVQEQIKKVLLEAYKELGEHDRPVVIVAQSLGGQVISNYLWDAESGNYIFKHSDMNLSDTHDFLRLKSLDSLFTTGCNIPLFIAGLDERVCFNKPSPHFEWHNYYDPDDVLAWPLKQLGETFRNIQDHPINAGGFLSSWNPLSHTKYWTDKSFVKPLANHLQQLLQR